MNKLLTILLLASSLSSTLLAQEQERKLRIGGALRSSYKLDYTKPTMLRSLGQFGYDVFRLNTDVKVGRWSLEAEYRFYTEANGGRMLKYGWLGYRPSDSQLWQIGAVPTPFGLNASGSNSFYLNLDYYTGLEDDTDLGIRYTYEDKGWMISAAFLKNDEYPSSGIASASRYGYDLGGKLREENQLNLYTHKVWQGEITHQVGLSGMIGQVRHIEIDERGGRYALAAYYMGKWQGFTLKGQYTQYRYMLPKGGGSPDAVTVTAYGGSHEIASHGSLWTGMLSYEHRLSPTTKLVAYNDLSILQKHSLQAEASIQNILGCRLVTGPITTYIEWISSHHHPFISQYSSRGALASGNQQSKWGGLIYVNIGYYF